MAYRTVNERFWRDPKVLRLSSNDKLLFIYLVTSADAHYSGVYYCPLQMIQLETGLSENVVSKGIDTLSKGYMVEYDYSSNEIFIINMAKFQVVSPTQIKGVATHFEETIQSQALIQSFIKKYDTLSIPYNIPCRGSIDTTETDRETDRETNIKNEKKERINTYTEDFEIFWSEYCRPEGKGSKPNAFKEWKKLTNLEKDYALENILLYKKSQKETQYMAHAERYLKGRLWEGLAVEETKPKKFRPVTLNDNPDLYGAVNEN